MEDFNQNGEIINEDTPIEPVTQPELQPEPVIETPPQDKAPADVPVDNEYTAAPRDDTVKSDETLPPQNEEFLYSAPLEKVTYTEQKPIKNYSPFSRGLKVFCAVLVVIIVATAACAGGYYYGKNKKPTDLFRSDVKVDLAAKPKDTDGLTAAQVYDKVNPSIVGVRVFNSQKGFDASGIIYTEDGYIITNDHIYEDVGAPNFKIYTYDGKEYDAEYVAGDMISDLAVLKIKNGSGFTVPVFGNSKELVCGESVYSIGRPSDAADDTSITAGTVSLPSRRMNSSRTTYSSSLIQTDSAINPGSSGGALVNMYGQVVGVTSSKLSGGDYDTISFSIPTVTVKRVVDQLIEKGKVTDRAKIGITYSEINSVTKQVGNYDAVGLLVVSVSSDSNLYGKISKGDIITHVNDVEITKDDIMLEVIESSRAGDEIEITVLSKSGDEKKLVVKLGANIGESSYSSKEIKNDTSSQKDNNSSNSDGTFDFPYGDDE